VRRDLARPLRAEDEELIVKKQHRWPWVFVAFFLSLSIGLRGAHAAEVQAVSATQAQVPQGKWVSGFLPHSALAQLKGDVRIHNYSLVASFVNQTRDWQVESLIIRLFLPKNQQALDLVLPLTDRNDKPQVLEPTQTGFAHAELNFMPNPWYWKVLSAKGKIWVDKAIVKQAEERWQFQY
jgi:hypothetical protein